MAQCTAKSKQSGERCKKDAIPGRNVCHIHGGKSLAGVSSPTFKHGRYSQVIPTRLAARYTASAADPALLELRSDIALVDSRLEDLLSRVDTGESGAIWRSLLKRKEELILAKRANDTAGQITAVNAILELISKGHADYRAWGEIGTVLEQRRKLVESERKRLVETQQMISTAEALTLIGQIVHVITEHVSDRQQLAAITAGVQKLITIDA